MIGVIALAPVSAALVQFEADERERTMKAVRDRAELLGIHIIDRQSRVIKEAHTALRFLSKLDEVRSGSPGCEAFLRRYIEMHQWMQSLSLAKPNGEEICSVHAAAGGSRPLDNVLVRKAAEEGTFVLSGVLSAHQSSALGRIAAAPVFDGQVVAGVLAAGIRAPMFENGSSAQADADLHTSMFVVNHRGVVVAQHPPVDGDAGTNMRDRPVVRMALDGIKESVEVDDLAGTPRFFTFRPLPDTDAILAVGIQRASVIGPFDHALRYRLVLISLIVGGSILLGALGFECLILRPLRNLIQIAEGLEHGTFTFRSSSRGFGEVRILERAFNRMAKAIADREQQLLRAKNVAEQALRAANVASQAKTDFLASMSHEIRTPLNGIIGYTEALLDEIRDSKQRRYAALIQVSASALLTVANDILEFSSIEADQIQLQMAPFSLLSVVDNAVSIVSSGAGKKGVPVRVEFDTSVPSMVVGDEARLRQILLNLLNNAVKFTREGHITAKVRHTGSEVAGERIRISIADTGIGIAPEHHERLFKRFSQGDPSIRREFGGTGLGLAICKRLIELMDGAIGVESQLGKGSEFWIELTLPKADDLHHHQNAAGVPVATYPARILLAEDIDINKELIELFLKAAGHVVESVSNGEEAVAAVRSRPYDLVLMDVQMPGMDGVTATQLIRGLDQPASKTPIIAMTANVLPQQVRAFLEAGMDGHIGKPVSRDDLLLKLGQWLSPAMASHSTNTNDECSSFDTKSLDEFRQLIGAEQVDQWLLRLDTQLKASFASDTSVHTDRNQMARTAHALIPQAALMGFSDLADLCTRLEQACLSGADFADLHERLRACAREVCRQITLITAVAHA
ncbi:ATP-binding protein [Microvirga sp. 0TCS3.31]